jgi:hypothetical protein
MNLIAYYLEQSWLAHIEMGLGALVRVELVFVAVFLTGWLVDRLRSGAGWWHGGRGDSTLDVIRGSGERACVAIAVKTQPSGLLAVALERPDSEGSES